jgi:hypothetical protein
MRLAHLGSSFLLALGASGQAQQPDTAAASPGVWNDNSLVTVEAKDGDATRSGDVRIEYYGHDAFRLRRLLVLRSSPIPGGMIQLAFMGNGS